MPAIELEQVYKSYAGTAVLRGLTLRIEQGELYGLLGPNGAGKSTLMHLLLGFRQPERGHVRVLGTSDLAQNIGKIGYVPERLRYHLRFSAREYLRLLGSLDDLRGTALATRIESELAAVGLSETANRAMATYSRGMLQRVGIAQALLHDPALLLIDEPTGGLDPLGQQEFLGLLAGVRQRGCSVLLATHYFDEIERVCDRVGILYDGAIAAEFPVTALRGPGYRIQITIDSMDVALAERLRTLSSAIQVEATRITIEPNSQPLQARVLRLLLDANVTILELETQIGQLAALYARVTSGQSLDGLVAAPAVAAPAERTVIPNGLFAPPGHPDFTSVAPNGDPLLRELLQRNEGED